MDTIAELTVRDEHLRGNYFSYDGCELFPAGTDTIEDEERLMRLAADVLLDILEKMRGDEA